MKVVIQVVNNASVEVENNLICKIDKGYLLLVGIEKGDDEKIVKKIAEKIINLRINEDENHKTNLSILDTKGEILSVSQFTLCAILDGRRPSFSNAEKPEISKNLYLQFNNYLRDYNVIVKEGIFGADMKVSLVNNGPFTIIIDSKNQ